MSKADEELMRLATEGAEPPEPKADAEDKPEADDTLELGGEDAPKVETDAANDDGEQPEKKTRSKRWEARVDNLTARLRDAERRAAEAEARITPAAEAVGETAPDPNDPKYELGEYDHQFIKDFARYEARQAIREENAKSAEDAAKAAEQQKLVSRLSEGMANIEKTGAEKYEDFDAKLAEAVEARGGEPLPPLVSVGIAVSPAGADIAYRLATDEAASDKLENLAKTNPQQAAVAFGELEGEFVDDDSDLNLADPMDMARMLGRMKSRLAGKKAPDPAERKTTKAPPPPETRARGGNGQFEVDDSTEDFAAFERKYMGKR